ncbi:MAG: hypothetical protein IJV01_00665 [Bacteroidales bacterium]|nr:hypothetical protein [Bacteroidales bacterium]
MKRLIGFDLDGTLTQHRTPLDAEHRALLDALGRRYKIIMVGAGNAPRIYGQMGNYPIDIIANYGMQESRMVDGVFTIVRDDKVEPDRDFFLRSCDYLRRKYGYIDYKGEPVEFHESGMVTFPLLGTKADIADKLSFDPDRRKRHVMYPEVLQIFKDYSVFVGGSSSFDITPAPYNKYDAMLRYGRENGYGVDEMLYVGDDFGDGGGDSHIRLGGMDYVEIDDYRNSPQRLQFLLD